LKRFERSDNELLMGKLDGLIAMMFEEAVL
jgi:hypothetical protein